MSDAPATRLIRGTISLGFASSVGMVMSLLGTIIITRRFPAEVFGTYTLLRVVVSFLGLVSSLGLEMSTIKFMSNTEDDGRKQALLSTAMLVRLLATALLSVAAWVGWPWLSRLFGGDILADWLIFVPLLFLLENTLSMLRAILQGFVLFERLAIIDLATNALNLFLIFIVVWFLKAGIVGLLLARAVSLVLPCLLAYFSIPLKKSLVFRFNALKDLVTFGFPLQINEILSFVYLRVDTLMIAALLGPADIAFYEIGRRIPDALNSLFQSMWSVYFPIMARLLAIGDRKRAAKLLNDSMRLVCSGCILGTAVVLLWGEDIVRLLFSERYLPSAPIFTLLMVSLSISSVGSALGTSLVAVGDSNKPPLINLIHTAASLLGNIVFIPAFGITGAAIVSLIGPVATNPFNVFFLLRRKLDVRISSYLKPLLVFGGWAALALLLEPTSFFEKIGLLTLLLLLFVFLSIVTSDDLKALIVGSRVESFVPRRLWPRNDKA